MKAFGSATHPDGLLHAVGPHRSPLLGYTAACDRTLPISWLRRFNEHEAWKVCGRSACQRAKDEAREAE